MVELTASDCKQHKLVWKSQASSFSVPQRTAKDTLCDTWVEGTADATNTTQLCHYQCQRAVPLVPKLFALHSFVFTPFFLISIQRKKDFALHSFVFTPFEEKRICFYSVQSKKDFALYAFVHTPLKTLVLSTKHFARHSYVFTPFKEKGFV